MADVKISALPLASTPLAGTEVLPIVQSATTDQVSVANLTAGRAVSAASLTLTTTPLAVGSGGTGLNTLTAGYIPYGNGTSAFGSSSALTFDGTNLLFGSSSATNEFRLTGSSSASNGPYMTIYKGATRTQIIGPESVIVGGGSTSNDLMFYNAVSAAFKWNIGSSTPSMVLDASGNLGIGITTPGSKIDIASGSGTAVTAVTIRSLAGNSNGFKIVTNSSTDNVSLVNYYAAPLIFGTNNVERARFNAGAPILCLSGGSTTATGTGIAFPATQSASSDANTLDDYEEGTWTPTLQGSTTNPTVTYTIQEGYYRKIGSLVYVSGIILLSAYSGGSGNVYIGGLPFTVKDLGQNYPVGTVGQMYNFTSALGDTDGQMFAIRPNNNSTQMSFLESNETSVSDWVVTNLSATFVARFTVSYISSN